VCIVTYDILLHMTFTPPIDDCGSVVCCVSRNITRSSATAEVARDVGETVIQGHSRSSVVVPIDAAYVTSY